MLYGKDWPSHKPSPCSDPTCRTNTTAEHMAASNTTFLDLRSPHDFDTNHIGGSISLPLPGLSGPGNTYLFDDIERLHAQWKSMKAMFSTDPLPHGLDAVPGPKVMICYNGETSRLATAVMRARGMEVFSIKGGMPALVQECCG